MSGWEEVQVADGTLRWVAQLNVDFKKTSEEVAFELSLCGSAGN